VPDKALKFLVGDRTGGHWSSVWRVGARSTSFYVKSLEPGLHELKVSLHGPDERHPSPGYKIGLDKSTQVSGTPRRSYGLDEDVWFPGRRINEAVDEVFRIRFPWDVFEGEDAKRLPPAPPRPRDSAHVAPRPLLGFAVDVHFYLSRSGPYWPDPQRVAQAKAGLGPLRNTAGQVLTGVVQHTLVASEPSPVVSLARDTNALPMQSEARIKSVAAVIDEHGAAWIEELWMKASDWAT
jgi:hypothetical protein